MATNGENIQTKTLSKAIMEATLLTEDSSNSNWFVPVVKEIAGTDNTIIRKAPFNTNSCLKLGNYHIHSVTGSELKSKNKITLLYYDDNDSRWHTKEKGVDEDFDEVFDTKFNNDSTSYPYMSYTNEDIFTIKADTTALWIRLFTMRCFIDIVGVISNNKLVLNGAIRGGDTTYVSRGKFAFYEENNYIYIVVNMKSLSGGQQITVGDCLTY